ncbi:MAG: hypothetical protein Q9216_003021 [Gyalolechia sp. 2 TL-2023]
MMLIFNLARPCARLRIPLIVPRRSIQNKAREAPIPWQQSQPYATTYGAIAVCCSVYAYNLYADRQNDKKQIRWHRDFIDKNLAISEENYNAGRWWTMVTHSAMHANEVHLAFNMVALASFGPMSIMMFGLPSTALIWVGSSLAGSWLMRAGNSYKARQARAGTTPKELEIFGHQLPHGQPTVRDPAHKSVGASSSVLGLFATVACSTPKNPVYVFPLPVPFPMGAMAVGIGLASAVAYTQDLLPGLGHMAHLGGMAFGVLYYVFALRRRIQLRRF